MHQKQGEKGEKEKEKKQVDASEAGEGGGETMKLDLHECAAAADTGGFKRKQKETCGKA